VNHVCLCRQTTSLGTKLSVLFSILMAMVVFTLMAMFITQAIIHTQHKALWDAMDAGKNRKHLLMSCG
jgi:hypothetical protein